ncbi:MAG: ABC transporter ATP-binding protein [Lachnospiraceae bacterium]|nr:ABC transporter ATP-binding protein [Lachnospiraceae bacterium]
MGAVIEIDHINRIFGSGAKQFQALTDINAVIPASKLTILKGRSGSGKTTLLNIIGALDEPTSGEIRMNGESLRRMSDRERENMRRNKFGFVFQAVSLIPTMSAYQNVEFALRMAGQKGNFRPRVTEMLHMVGLGNRMNHMPAELSGGEQQRVAIARAIAHHPEVVLADEPTAELDSAMAAEVTRLLKELTRTENVTVVMTTHDVGLMDAGDHLIELESGRVVEHE